MYTFVEAQCSVLVKIWQSIALDGLFAARSRHVESDQ